MNNTLTEEQHVAKLIKNQRVAGLAINWLAFTIVGMFAQWWVVPCMIAWGLWTRYDQRVEYKLAIVQSMIENRIGK